MSYVVDELAVNGDSLQRAEVHYSAIQEGQFRFLENP
jgi:hypothetical protein